MNTTKTYSNQSTDDVDNEQCTWSDVSNGIFDFDGRINFSSFFCSSVVFICVRKISMSLLPFDCYRLTRAHLTTVKKKVAYNGINYRFIHSVCGCAICRRPNHSTPNSLNKEISKQTNTPAWIGWKTEEKKRNGKENFKFLTFPLHAHRSEMFRLNTVAVTKMWRWRYLIIFIYYFFFLPFAP